MGSSVIAGVVALSGCDAAPDVAAGGPPSTSASTGTTTAPTTVPPTTGPPTTAPSTSGPSAAGSPTAARSSDPATAAVDRLLEVFNAEDAEGVAGIFGDEVAFTLESGEDVVGPDAAAFWQGYIGRETGERITEAFHASDGLTYFLTVFTFSGGSTTLVFDVEMEGERVIRMGARPRNLVELLATGEVDDLHEAFNDQDLDRLTDLFEGITYTSPAGVELAGEEAAEHWAASFGSAVTRTTGVFAPDARTAGFVAEHTEPGSSRSTAYAVEVEVSGGHVTSITERMTEPRP